MGAIVERRNRPRSEECISMRRKDTLDWKMAAGSRRKTTLLCKGDTSECSFQGKPKIFPNI